MAATWAEGLVLSKFLLDFSKGICYLGRGRALLRGLAGRPGHSYGRRTVGETEAKVQYHSEQGGGMLGWQL